MNEKDEFMKLIEELRRIQVRLDVCDNLDEFEKLANKLNKILKKLETLR